MFLVNPLPRQGIHELSSLIFSEYSRLSSAVVIGALRVKLLSI